MKVQFRDTLRGEVAILPRAEYERLKAIAEEADEDAGTARLVATAQRELAEGGALLPLTVMDRLATGENPVRVLRQFRDRTQAELAASVQIAQNYLSDIEAGKRKGPFELHRKIAASLGVPFDLLAPIAVVMRASDAKRRPGDKHAIAKMRKSRGQK